MTSRSASSAVRKLQPRRETPGRSQGVSRLLVWLRDAAHAHAAGESLTDRVRLGVIAAQGVYYAIAGLWPLVSNRSFQAVTGAKTDHLVTGREADHWLVMTAGVLIVAVAAALLTAAARRAFGAEVAVLALASAVGLLAIDLIYVARRAIAPIYLVDAAIEAIIITVWLGLLASDAQRRAGR